MKKSLSINSNVFYRHPSLRAGDYIENYQVQSFNLEQNKEYELSYIIKELISVVTEISFKIIQEKFKNVKEVVQPGKNVVLMNKGVEYLSELLNEYVGMLSVDEKEMFLRSFFNSLKNIQKYENSYEYCTQEALEDLDIYPSMIKEWKDFSSFFDSKVGSILFNAQDFFSLLLKSNFNMFDDDILGNGLFKSVFKVLADHDLLKDVKKLKVSKFLNEKDKLNSFYFLKACFDYPVIREKVGLNNIYKSYLSNVQSIESSINQCLVEVKPKDKDNLIFFRNLFITSIKKDKVVINKDRLIVFINKIEDRLIEALNYVNKKLTARTNKNVSDFYSGEWENSLFNGYHDYGCSKLILNWMNVIDCSYNLLGEKEVLNPVIKRQLKKINTVSINEKKCSDYLEVNLKKYIFFYLFKDVFNFETKDELGDYHEVNSLISDYLIFINRITFLKKKGKLSDFKKNELQIEFEKHNEKIIEQLNWLIFNENEVKSNISLNLSLSFDDLIIKRNVKYNDIKLIIKSNLFDNEELSSLIKCCFDKDNKNLLNEEILRIEKNKMKKQNTVKIINKKIKKF